MEPNDQPSPYPYLISVRGSRPVAARRDGSYYVCAYQVQLGLWWAARDVTVLEYDPSRNFYREQRQAYLASHPEAVTDPIAIAPHEASPEVAGPATPESSGRAEPDPTAATAPATPPPVGGSVSQDERPAPTDGVPVEAELPRVWFLTAEELAATQAKVAALRKRAARKGFTGQIDLAAVPATRTYQSAGGLPVTEHGFDVTITGEPPRYAGWRFVAAVDAVEGGTIVRYPPGSTTTIANDQIRAGQCDHCHTRRAPPTTVLVTHEDTGHLLQVGRTCLKDFL